MAEAAAPLDPNTVLRDQVAPRVRRRMEELRAQISRLEAEFADRMAAEATVEIVLEGTAGGTWYLNVAQGTMTVSDEPVAPPLVRVRQTRDDWEALAREELGSADAGMPPGADLTRSRVERMRGLAGALEFRLLDEGAGEPVERRTLVHFGPGDPGAPRCTLRMKAADARRMRRGELQPQAAFLQGLVKLEGDLAFAMQVGAVLFM
jgi:putative sterol carrier protein